MVTALFKDVKNIDLEKMFFPYEEHPWQKEHLGNIMFITSLPNIRRLRLNFPTPEVLDQYKVSVSLQWNKVRKITSPKFFSI